MLEISRIADTHSLGFVFTKEVTERDLDAVISAIDGALEVNDKISILCDMVDFESLTAKALLKDLLYGIGSLGRMYRFERIAVVADSAVLKTIVDVESQLFRQVELKSFPSTDRQQALSWIALPIDQPVPGVAMTEVEAGNYIRVDVKDTVSGHDVRRVCCAIRNRYQSHGPVNLLVTMDGRPHWGPGLLYEKLCAFEVMRLISRYAVTAPQWARPVVEAVGAMVRTRLRFFPSERLTGAIDWLTDPMPAVYIYPLVRGHMVAMCLAGKLTEREIEQVYYLLLPHLQHEGGIDLLLEVPYDEGMTLQGVAKAIQLGIRHYNELTHTIRRLAVVTDSRWISKAVQAENLLLPRVEERAFTFAQRDEAEAWLFEGRAPENQEGPRDLPVAALGP